MCASAGAVTAMMLPSAEAAIMAVRVQVVDSSFFIVMWFCPDSRHSKNDALLLATVKDLPDLRRVIRHGQYRFIPVG